MPLRGCAGARWRLSWFAGARCRLAALLLVALGFLPGLSPPGTAVAGLAAQVPGAPASVQDAIVGQIEGRVLNALNDAPVVGAQVRVRELGRGDLSHADGSFHLQGLRAGEYTVAVQMLGYAGAEQRVRVEGGQTALIEFRLEVSALSLPGIVVTAVGTERGLADTYRPTSVLSGAELERRISWSLASTLRYQQGISMQSFGPAPAQPVVRGMGGDRVLVLEDGQRTGDLSTTGPDHAVGVDPTSAERIEVVRGPAGLLYGSNALGGVINVIREEVPRALPERTTGVVTFGGATVNRGLAAAATVSTPLGSRFALRAEVGGREGGDVRTPLGVLPSTDSRGVNGSVGASWLPSWGYLGVSYRGYLLDHGIPGEFQGEEIPGAHEGGADAETRRQVGRFQLGHVGGIGPFSSLQLEGNVVHYLHREIEGVLDSGERIIGTSFDQLTATVNVVAGHQHTPGMVREEGTIGAFVSYRDLITGGSFPGVRDAREQNVALFVHEEVEVGRYRLQLGGRYDWHRVEPVDLRPIDAGGGLMAVRTRTFGDLSGSVSGLVALGGGWTLGVSLARAFRTPSVRELFSAGPHLADFSYDVGNPELGREVGLGADLFLRANLARANLEGTLFRNRIQNFIHDRPTGLLDPRFRRFPLYVADGADAEFLGADGRIEVEVATSLVVDGTFSYVRAEYAASGEALPSIPPLSGGVRLRYEPTRYFLTASWDGTGAQRRVAAPIPDPSEEGSLIHPELPTPGHHLFGVGAGIRWIRGEQLHSLTLGIDNLLDRSWRDHLSRTKEVAPESGRNVQLLYRVRF